MLVFWTIIIIESLAVSFFIPAPGAALSDAVYWILIVVNLVLFFVFAMRSEQFRNKKILTYFFIGLLLRLAFMTWVQYFSDIFLLPNAEIDEYTFYYRAMGILIKEYSVDNYSAVVAFEARFVGLSILYLRFLNLLLSLQSLLIFGKILDKLDLSDSTYDTTMMLAWVLPSFALISVLLLRESIMIFLITCSLYCFIRWWNEESRFAILWAIAFAVTGTWFHIGPMVIAVGEAAVCLFSRHTEDGREFRLDKGRVFLLTALMIVTFVFIDVFGSLFGVESVEGLVGASEDRVEGGSGYAASVIPVGGTLGVLLNSPFHAIMFLGSPFPWQWRGISDILAFCISAVFYLSVLYMTIKEIRKYNSGCDLLNALLVIAIVGMIVFGWGVSNAGTALRHRDKLVFLYLLMFALARDSQMETESKQLRRLRREEA